MFLKIIEITFPIFLIVLVGFFYSRYAKPDLGGANKMLVDVALPVLIFTSLSAKNFDPASLLSFTTASVLLIVLSGGLAWIVTKWSKSGWSGDPAWRGFLPCVMFGNVGPVGLPMIMLTYGTQGLAPAVVLLVISNLLHFTLGSGVMSGKIDWRMVYANPLVWATILGIASSQLQLAPPQWISTGLGMIGSVLVPMMLLSLGARLASSKIDDARIGAVSSVYIVALRLFAAFVILQVIPLGGLERGVLILFACLPSAVFNYLLADKFQVVPNKVASTVIVSHVWSLAFLPLGLWLALRT